jgi:secreted trypsin-like serine protease
MSTRKIEVVLNEENKVSTTESETKVLKVSKIIMHPEYSRRNVNNDIAVSHDSRSMPIMQS